jgi:phosphate-selective porin
MYKYFKVIVVFFIPLLSIVASCCVANEMNPGIAPTYHWGRGLSIPSADLTLGGYVNASYKHFESKSDVASLNDLSLFIGWSPHAQIRFFTELEMEGLVSTRYGVADFSESFSLERLYVDILFSDTFSARFGQFLTPVGVWNTIHASPLVWTTSRPIATKSELFPSRTNGLMLVKQFIVNNHGLEFSFYVDDSDALDPRKIFNTDNGEHINAKVAFKHAIGTHLLYEPIDSLKTGFSYLAYKKRADISLSTNHFLGVDLFWEKEGYEIQMEFSYRIAGDEQGSEAGGYLQGVAPLGNNVFAIARYEFIDGKHQYEEESVDGTTHVGVSALAWRPYIPLVVKAEYRFGSNNEKLAPSGFFASVSMLF